MSHGAGIGELEGLYRARYRHFLRVAVLITADQELAHDAVQEGFAGAVKARRSFRGEGPLEAWVWRAVVNAARKRQRSEANLVAAIEPVGENGDAADQRLIRVWIASLPERQRLIVFLRYYADLDYRAIATALEIKVGTVSATLNAAHESLRRSMEEVRR